MMTFPIYGKTKNVPNNQPDSGYLWISDLWVWLGLTRPRFSSLGFMHLNRTQLDSCVQQVTTSFDWHIVKLNKSEVKHIESIAA